MKKRMRITVNGKTYDVEAEILDETQSAAHASSPVMSSAGVEATSVTRSAPKSVPNVPRVSGTPGDVPCPIAGTVISILTPEGSTVATGDVLLVLEAMKMNTEVTSPCDGTVEKVNISQGESVEEGQTLLSIA